MSGYMRAAAAAGDSPFNEDGCVVRLIPTFGPVGREGAVLTEGAAMSGYILAAASAVDSSFDGADGALAGGVGAAGVVRAVVAASLAMSGYMSAARSPFRSVVIR